MAWWDDLVDSTVGFGKRVGNALGINSGFTPNPNGRVPTGGNYFNPDPTKNFNPGRPIYGPAIPNNAARSLSSRQTTAPGSFGVAPNSQPFSPIMDPNERASRQLAGQSGFGSGNLGKLMTGQYVPGMADTQASGDLMAGLQSLMGGGYGGGTPQISTFDKSLQDYLAAAGSGEDLIANQLRSLDKERATGRSDAAEGKAAVGSIYGGLKKSFNDDKKISRQQNKLAQKDIQSSADAASASLTNALAAGNSDIAQTLANLGISDAAGQAQATRDEYGIQNADTAARRGEADIAELVSRGQTQQDFLTESGAAAGFAGSDAQSEIQRDLLGYLQAIGGRESQLRDNAALQARNNAVQQYNADAEAFYRQQQAQVQAAEMAAQQDQQAWQRAMDAARLNWDQTQYYDQAQREQAQMAAEAGMQGGLNNKGYVDADNFLRSYFKTEDYAADAMAKAQQALAQVPAGGGYADAAQWLQQQYANRSPSVGQGALQALYLLTGGKI